MKAHLLEEVARRTGKMISDFRYIENRLEMYECLKNIGKDAYALEEWNTLMQYVMNNNELMFSSIDAILTYLKERV